MPSPSAYHYFSNILLDWKSECDIARNISGDFRSLGKWTRPVLAFGSRLFFIGEQFLSDKLLLHASRPALASKGFVRGKNRGGGGVSLSLPTLRHSGARCFARRCDGACEGSRTAEKVDQYQAKRSAPTNLCGDPSNDTSRSLQLPNRFLANALPCRHVSPCSR